MGATTSTKAQILGSMWSKNAVALTGEPVAEMRVTFERMLNVGPGAVRRRGGKIGRKLSFVAN